MPFTLDPLLALDGDVDNFILAIDIVLDFFLRELCCADLHAATPERPQR